MFDNYLVRANSLRNETLGGEVVGFSLAVRHANYRGVYLSLHNGYFIELDGVSYPVSVQKFEINGKAPRSFDETRTAVWEHWDYDDEAILHIQTPGGLESGTHKGKQFDGVIIVREAKRNAQRVQSSFVWRDDDPPYPKSRRLLRVGITRARTHLLIPNPLWPICPLLKGQRL